MILFSSLTKGLHKMLASDIISVCTYYFMTSTPSQGNDLVVHIVVVFHVIRAFSQGQPG